VKKEEEAKEGKNLKCDGYRSGKGERHDSVEGNI